MYHSNLDSCYDRLLCTMGELVSTITNLCKLLNCIVNVTIKPEIFRLAKLNKLATEQTLELWDVCHKLCCFTGNTNPCNCNPCECVDSFLSKRNSVAAYFVTPVATGRQLLLCLGFLLSEGIIERNVDELLMATPLGEELPSFMIKPETDSDNLAESLTKPDKDDPQALLYYASFLAGKVQHNLRAILNHNQEKAKMFVKIHETTADFPGCSYLSVGDLVMGIRPELQPEFLSRCQHCTPLLQAYCKWRRKKHVFWEWMVSVVEEEFKTNCTHLSVSDITHLHGFLRKVKRDVQKPQIIEEKRLSDNMKIWATSRRIHLGENSDIADSVITNMDLEINNLTKHITETVDTIKNECSKFKNDKQINALNFIVQSLTDCSILETNVSRDSSNVELPSVDVLKID